MGLPEPPPDSYDDSEVGGTDGGTATSAIQARSAWNPRPTTSHGRRVEVQVTATVESMLGLANTPGEIPGVGPIPAGVIREMARDAALRFLAIGDRDGQLLYRCPTSWRADGTRHTEPDGRVGHEHGLCRSCRGPVQPAERYRPTTGTAGVVIATWVDSAAPHSTVPATRCDLDHVVAWPVGATVPANLAPLDRRWHRAKTRAGITVTALPDGRLRWTTPLGQTLDVDPYDYRLGP